MIKIIWLFIKHFGDYMDIRSNPKKYRRMYNDKGVRWYSTIITIILIILFVVSIWGHYYL